MAAFVKLIGWLATAVGVAFIILPFIVTDGLSVDTMVSLCIFLLVTGPLLIGLSQLIEVAEKIQSNTSWFSTGGMPQGQPVAEEVEAPQPSEPETTLPPLPDPVQEETPPPQPPRERSQPRAERQPQRPQPQLYDANVHPAAVDEWSHNGRRVMTLEDSTFATEIDGAWYRFLKLDDIDALRR